MSSWLGDDTRLGKVNRLGEVTRLGEDTRIRVYIIAGGLDEPFAVRKRDDRKFGLR